MNTPNMLNNPKREAFIPFSFRDDGVGVVDMGPVQFPIWCMSRKRAVRLLDMPLLPYTNVIVHEDEADTYRDVFDRARSWPASLQTHRTYSCAKVRDVIAIEWYRPDTESFTFQVDDEFRYLMSIGAHRFTKHDDPFYMLQVIAHTGLAAKDAGAPLFFPSGGLRTPTDRHAYEPFVLRRWAATGFFGWIDPDLRMDENIITSEDLDLALMAIARSKFIWIDTRWLGVQDEAKGRMRGNTMGDSAWISEKLIRMEQRYLQRKWGMHVVHTYKEALYRPGQGYQIIITVPQKYEDQGGPSKTDKRDAKKAALLRSRLVPGT